MQITNWKTCPGPGDMLPLDTSVRDEALAAIRNEAESFLAESIANERMASIAWVSDAQCDFSTAEYDEITAAIINADLADKAGSDAALPALARIGRLMLEATRRSIKRDADKAAQECADRMEKEDEADYCAEVAV